MKVTLSRSALVDLIGRIQGILSTKPSLPILANILLEAKDGNLMVSATDLTVSMQSQMKANSVEEGAITLPGNRFFQLVRELTVPTIAIEVASDEIATIQAGTATFRFNGMNGSEFPQFPNLSQSIHFFIKVATLKEMFEKSVFAVAKENSRYVLNGVLMQIENCLASFIGADGKRLARVSTPITIPDDHRRNYLIPLKGVTEIIKSLHGDGDEEVKVYLMEDRIGIECDSTLLITKLLTGDYPDVERVIPKESVCKLILHREELVTLLKQVALFTNDKSHSVSFTFTAGELTLKGHAGEIGDGVVSMPVDYSGDPFEMAFNPHFFIDILRHCNDETVHFAITPSHNPGLITDSTSAEFVIMPMRLPQVQ